MGISAVRARLAWQLLGHNIYNFHPQPGDDIVFMAQTLEKLFLQKLTTMPKDECDITAITAKEPVKGRKTNAGILHINSP